MTLKGSDSLGDYILNLIQYGEGKKSFWVAQLIQNNKVYVADRKTASLAMKAVLAIKNADPLLCIGSDCKKEPRIYRYARTYNSMVNIFLDIDDFRLLIRETAWLEGKHNSGVFVPYRLEISGEHFITSDLYNTLVDSVIRCADEIAHKRYTSQPILEWSISPVSIEG